MIRTWKALLMLGVLVPAAAAAESLEVTGTIRVSSATAPAPFGLPTRALEVSATRPESLVEPEGLHEPVYASLALAGRTIHIVVAKGAADSEAPDVIGVDRDGDGVLSPEERQAVAPSRQDDAVRGSAPGVPVRRGEAVFPLDVAFRRVGDGPVTMGVRANWFLEAEMRVGDAAFLVDVRDGDADGFFSGEDDYWLVRTTDPLVRPLEPLSLSARDEGRFLGGLRFRLVAVEGLRLRLEATPAKGPDPEDLARHRERVARVWAERFEPTRAAFEERYLIDPARPRAMNPVRWRWVTFAEALRLAAQEDRLLFVDLRSFESAACYRLDVHTYPDQEVADLLNKDFVPVMILEEQDLAGELGRLRREIGGALPAMGVWSKDGKLVHRISGWRKPTDLVFELNAALETVKANAKEPAKPDRRGR